MEKSVLQTYLEDLQYASRNNRLVVFVGAGVSNNSGVPVWGRLIDALKAELPEFIKWENDDLKVAQIYKTTYPDKFLDKVKLELKNGCIVPNAVHDALLDLKPCHIITTNYDDLIEQACRKRYAQYAVIGEDADLPKQKNERFIIKMHGDFNKGNIVLAEQDYYDYSRNFSLIRSFVLSLFASKTVLFIGFSFADINLKYILRELQTILQKNMQPVYMLTGASYSHEQTVYMEDKGIRPVCLATEDADDIIRKQGLDVETPESLTIPQGRLLYKQLQIIGKLRYDADVLVDIVDSLSGYTEEMPTFGFLLPSLLPQYLQDGFAVGEYKLSVRNSAFKNIILSISDVKGLLRFCRKYKDVYRRIMKIAFDNSIYYVGDICIFSPKQFATYAKAKPNDGAYNFFMMNIDAVKMRIEELSKRNFTSSRDDLELPYLYYLVGQYGVALQMFSELAKKYWEAQRYILYFICRINMDNLAHKTFFFSCEVPTYKILAKNIRNADLKNVLYELPLEENIRKVFEEFVSCKIFIERSVATYKLDKAVVQQRKNAENGGFGLNNHPIQLMYEIAFLMDVCINNYLIIDNKYTRQTFLNIANALVESLLIDDNVPGNTKTNSLITPVLLVFLFNIDNSDLQKILGKCENKDLKLDEIAKDYVRDIVSNLKSLGKLDKEKYCWFDNTIISNVIRNLFSLLCVLPKDCVPSEGIYKLAVDNMRIMDELFYSDMMPVLMRKVKPTADEALDILNVFIRPISKYHNKPYFLNDLAVIAANGKKVLAYNGDFADLDNLDVISLAALYPAFEERQREKLKVYLCRHISTLYEALRIERSGMGILDEELFNRLKSKFLSENHIDDDFFVDCCYQLKMVYKEDKYIAYKKSIEEIINVVPCLAFIINPQEHIDEIRIEWLVALEDDELKRLLYIPDVTRKIDEYCRDIKVQ